MKRIRQFCINAAPAVGVVAMILLLVSGVKMVSNLTSVQNQCVAAQVAAGVEKTNPKDMGCV